jgi:hypothetical protein
VEELLSTLPCGSTLPQTPALDGVEDSSEYPLEAEFQTPHNYKGLSMPLLGGMIDFDFAR